MLVYCLKFKQRRRGIQTFRLHKMKLTTKMTTAHERGFQLAMWLRPGDVHIDTADLCIVITIMIELVPSSRLYYHSAV